MNQACGERDMALVERYCACLNDGDMEQSGRAAAQRRRSRLRHAGLDPGSGTLGKQQQNASVRSLRTGCWASFQPGQWHFAKKWRIMCAG